MTEWEPPFEIPKEGVCRDGCVPSFKAASYVWNQVYNVMYSDAQGGTVDHTYAQFYTKFTSELVNWMSAFPEDAQIGFYSSMDAFLRVLDREVGKMQSSLPQINALKSLGAKPRAQWINWIVPIPHEEDKIKVDASADVGETMGMCNENGQIAVLYQNTRDPVVVTQVLEEKGATQNYVSVIDDSMNAWRMSALSLALARKNIVVRTAYNAVLVFFPPYFKTERNFHVRVPPHVDVRAFYEFHMMRYEMKRLANLSAYALHGAAHLWMAKTIQMIEMYSPFLQVVPPSLLREGQGESCIVKDPDWIGEVRWEIGVRVFTLEGEALSKTQVSPVRALPRVGNIFFLNMTPDMFCYMCSSQREEVFRSNKQVLTSFLQELIKLTLIPDVLAPNPEYLPPPPPPPVASGSTDPTVATTGYVPPTVPTRARTGTYTGPAYNPGDVLQPMRSELESKKTE